MLVRLVLLRDGEVGAGILAARLASRRVVVPRVDLEVLGQLEQLAADRAVEVLGIAARKVAAARADVDVEE